MIWQHNAKQARDLSAAASRTDCNLVGKAARQPAHCHAAVSDLRGQMQQTVTPRRPPRRETPGRCAPFRCPQTLQWCNVSSAGAVRGHLKLLPPRDRAPLLAPDPRPFVSEEQQVIRQRNHDGQPDGRGASAKANPRRPAKPARSISPPPANEIQQNREIGEQRGEGKEQRHVEVQPAHVSRAEQNTLTVVPTIPTDRTG